VCVCVSEKNSNATGDGGLIIWLIFSHFIELSQFIMEIYFNKY
jgi:hypothetical protein